MGTTKINVRDWESVNFDKLCALALEVRFVLALDPNDIEFVRAGGEDLDVEGDVDDRMYWKRGLRSMTEAMAIRLGLGKPNLGGDELLESPIVGLVPLCLALARNHGKMGKGGGQLYARNSIPMLSRNLALLPEQAPEIAKRIVIAVAQALSEKAPIAALHTATVRDVEGFWDEANQALGQAEYRARDLANGLVADLDSGASRDDASLFRLELAPAESPAAQALVVWTANPNLMKHFWSAVKPIETLRIVAAVVVHPETRRIAVLTASHEEVDVEPIVEAIKAAKPGVEIDVNRELGRFTWDPRFSTKAFLEVETVMRAVSEHLRVRTTAPARPQAPTLKASLGDKLKHLT